MREVNSNLTMFDKYSQHGVKRHTKERLNKLKEFKSFHKEYNQCLNNTKTKYDLIQKILNYSTKTESGFEFNTRFNISFNPKMGRC